MKATGLTARQADLMSEKDTLGTILSTDTLRVFIQNANFYHTGTHEEYPLQIHLLWCSENSDLAAVIYLCMARKIGIY